MPTFPQLDARMWIPPTLLVKVQIRGDPCCLGMGLWEPPQKMASEPKLVPLETQSLLSFSWGPGPEDLGCCGVTEVERSGPCCWGHEGQLGWALMPNWEEVRAVQCLLASPGPVLAPQACSDPGALHQWPQRSGGGGQDRFGRPGLRTSKDSLAAGSCLTS